MRRGCVVVLALTALMTGGSLADGPSLLRDGSFEDARFQEHGWAAYACGGSTLARDTKVARTGAASVRMDLPASAAGEYPAYKYRVDGVKVGARYDGAVWARTEDATGLGGYYGDHKQEYGLWRHGEEGWKPRPGYYAWSLLTRYTQPRSRVLAMSVEPAAFHVRAVALRAPNGALTCLVANRYPRSLNARLQLGKSRANCAVFNYTRDAVAAAGDGMLAGKLLPPHRTGSVDLTLPAEAFVLVRVPPGS
jgi:hypothetical protein